MSYRGRAPVAGEGGCLVIDLSSNNNPEAGDAAAGSTGEAESPPVRQARVVRYGAMGYLGEFTAKSGFACRAGAKLVVQTERGIELGEPVGVPRPGCGCDLAVPQTRLQTYVKNCGMEFCRPRAGRILRIASEQDVNEHSHLNAHVRQDVDYCAERAHYLGLDVKIVTAEHLLGGERIVFYFSAPTRVDFRQLVKELAQRYRTRIEMRQVGARDEARLVADYEVCGRECCCRNFLKKLRPVNMKMAKLQKSTLDPSKVSGRCGRLRCCLRYEHEGYEELARRLPRMGSRVDTEFGPATVQDRQVLTQLLMVRTDDDRVFAIPLEEIKAFDLPPPPPRQEPAVRSGTSAGPADRPERSRPSRRPPRGSRAPAGDVARPAARETPPAVERESKFVPERAAADSETLSTPEPGEAGPAAGAGAPGEPAAGHESPARRRRRRRRRRVQRDGPPPPREGAPGA